MELRTSNLILVIKQPGRIGAEDSKEAMAKYLSVTCGLPEEDYIKNPDWMIDVAETAFFDYFEGCKDKALTVKEVFARLNTKNSWVKNPTLLDAIIGALRAAQVKERDGNNVYHYINGFDERIEHVYDENDDGKTIIEFSNFDECYEERKQRKV